MPSLISPIGKDFAIYLNSTQHANVIVNDSLLIDHVYESVVDLTAGTLKLEFVESGSVNPFGDSLGTYIGIVEMFQLIEKQQNSSNTTNTTNTNNTTNINQNQIATLSGIFGPPFS